MSENLTPDCALPFCEDLCQNGCQLFHGAIDCQRRRRSKSKDNYRESRPTTKNMVYKRYRSTRGRFTSFTRDQQGGRYRDMRSPGRSNYREYKRSKSPDNERRQSTDRKNGDTYKMNSLQIDDSSYNDKYSNLYPLAPN